MNLHRMTKEQLIDLFNRCALNSDDEFDYEGEDGELMAKIEIEMDRRAN